ncbi:MAG: trehalose synthase [Cytophagales bacterium]|nr:MAG: trehalose synthase [Cytophagales bacterium]
MPQTQTLWPQLAQDTAFWQTLTTDVLPAYVNTCRWFAGKARAQTGFTVEGLHQWPTANSLAYLLILGAHYQEGESERYLLPLAFVANDSSDLAEVPDKGRIAPVEVGGQAGVLVDAIYTADFRSALFAHIGQNKVIEQAEGRLACFRGRGLAEAGDETIPSRVLPVDSSNSAMVFGTSMRETYFLKLYRKLFELTNPEVEMVAFLTEEGGFDHIPAYCGSVVWQQANSEITLGMVQRMVPNEQDSWNQTGDYLNDFLYAVPNRMFAISEDVFDKVELLGKRTGQMHCGLYQPKTTDAAFAPEPFTDEYRAFLIGRFNDLLDRRYALLVDNYAKLDAQAQRLAWVFMEAKEMIDAFVEEFRTRPIHSLRIRIHGDYHLGQVLATQDDFVIIDFEGEPESTIADRKIKHSPLKDVAGMIRSYHYAVSAKLFNAAETAHIDPDHLQRVSDRWFYLIRDTYLDAYLEEFGSPHPLFNGNNEINFLLLVYLLEKAVYELGYEISYRPAWVKIPLKGIIDVIREIEKIRLDDRGHDSTLPMLQTGLLK